MTSPRGRASGLAPRPRIAAAPLVAAAVLLLGAAGCGGDDRAAGTMDGHARTARVSTTPADAVRVATVGDVRLRRAGLARSGIDDADLVVVAPEVRDVAKLARDHPAAHVVLVGRSHASAPGPNVTGLLFREDEAAYLAGTVAGLVTAEEGARDPAVAWVGTRARAGAARAFRRGVRAAAGGGVRVIQRWAPSDPARCKESALEAILRGATVVFAGGGPCASGALAAASDQNAVGLELADFERPAVAVSELADEARRGLFHRGEDVVFGAASGAVGVGRLDPRVSADTIARAKEVEAELAAGAPVPR